MPLTTYLTVDRIRDWRDHSAETSERRANSTHLEQAVKMLLDERDAKIVALANALLDYVDD